ncbi:hypothetical protein NDU88_005244 [Pleurodeles waltl]|uniref:Uncharacterized protein n=1 Tax=Pleurodeles waltl TaxID=8319 RepID=A0AAV7W7I2_PLEWA|nr:hypothetical protein NDU88_005244 [Pleurodeles waltl]
MECGRHSIYDTRPWFGEVAVGDEVGRSDVGAVEVARSNVGTTPFANRHLIEPRSRVVDRMPTTLHIRSTTQDRGSVRWRLANGAVPTLLL